MRLPLTSLLAAALVVSLALHARRLFVHPAEPRPVTVAPAPASAPCAPCEEKLARCENRSWDLVRKAFATPVATERPAAGAPPPEPTGVDRAVKEAALCKKAEAMMRETWERDRDKTLRSLTRSLDDREEQERNLQHDLGSLRDSLGVDPARGPELERAYRESRFARIDAARAALASDPPDLAAVSAAARGLFADEDALAARFAGASGSQVYQESELEGRVVILALLATLDGKELGEALR